MKNCGYEEAENLLLSRGISKPLFSVEAWRGGRVFPADVDDVASSACPDGAELSSENLVAEILLNMPPPPFVCNFNYDERPERGGVWPIAIACLISFVLLLPFNLLIAC